MTDRERAEHPQEPAEGSNEDVEAPGIDEARDDMGAPPENLKERTSAHPQEPARAAKIRSTNLTPIVQTTPPSSVLEIIGLLKRERAGVQAG